MDFFSFVLDIWFQTPIFRGIMGCVLGAIIGSFLNVCISRWPEGQSIIRPSSHCKACGKKIPFWYNIPIMSYFCLKGRCAYCHQSIGMRHVLVEILMLGMGGFFMAYFPNSEGIIGFIFVSILIIGAISDWETFTLPAPVLAVGFILGCISVVVCPQLQGASSGIEALGWGLLNLVGASGVLLWMSFVFEMILKKPALGLGDVYWIGIIAFFVGPLGALFSLFGGAFLGLLFVCVACFCEKFFKKSIGPRLSAQQLMEEHVGAGEDIPLGFNVAVPFGPWLSLAAGIYFICLRSYSVKFIEIFNKTLLLLPLIMNQ